MVFIVLQITLLPCLYAGEPPSLFDIVENGTPEAVQEAIWAGADVNVRNDFGESGMTVLSYALRNKADTEIVKLLIEAGADANAWYISGDGGYKFNLDTTPLIEAIRHSNNPDIIRLLLDAGAEVNVRTNYDLTPLLLAVGHSFNLEIIQTLIDAGAEVDAKDSNGETALLVAGRCWHDPMLFRMLLEAGANVNAQDDRGLTLLIYVAGSGSPEIIEMLLDAGADAKVIHNGKTAWDGAQRNEKLKGTKAYEKLKKATFE
jgi:ankyrin repeat protein